MVTSTEGKNERWLEIAGDYHCNHRCLGCSATSGGPEQSHGQLLRALDEGIASGIDQLWIGGGEPTLRPDLLALVRAARARGYRRVRLQTNGVMLSYPEVTRRLRDAGLDEVAFSIQGPDALTHDRFCRSEGAFVLLGRAIENARAADLVLEGDVLLYRSTTALLARTVAHFFGRGLSRFRVWRMAPPEDDAEALAEEPRLDAVGAAIEATLALGLSADPSFLLSLHTPPCVTPVAARFFAPDLGLTIHDASGRRFQLESSPIEGGAFAPPCVGCRLRARCLGVRPEYLARHGFSELRPERG